MTDRAPCKRCLGYRKVLVPVGPVPVGGVVTVDPVGVEPVGVEPVGVEPVGVEPVGVEPSVLREVCCPRCEGTGKEPLR
jgi:hypothetical protein